MRILKKFRLCNLHIFCCHSTARRTQLQPAAWVYKCNAHAAYPGQFIMLPRSGCLWNTGSAKDSDLCLYLAVNSKVCVVTSVTGCLDLLFL